MNHGRDKRVLLGLMAALAPLPLPFNDVVGWPSVVLFWVGVGLFLRRAWNDVGGWLPNWAMNALALAYLPVLFFDFTALWRGRVLQPVVHLLLYALVVKLFALKREKDKWQVALVLFFLFLAATGTSVHPAVVLYVLAFLVAALLMFSRFATWEMLARHPRRAPALDDVPLRGFVTGGTLFALVAAIPLFIFMPRLRTPYMVGPGGGYGSLTQVASFDDVMRLDGIGRVRGSRAVVMRLTYETPPPASHEARIKVMTYDSFEDDRWTRRQRTQVQGGQRMLRRLRDGTFAVRSGAPESWMGVWMQPFGGYNLALPVDAVRVDWTPSAVEGLVMGTGSGLVLDDAGVAYLPLPRPNMVRYRVGLAGGSGSARPQPTVVGDPELDLDVSGVSPRVAELAARTMGEGSAFERAERAERFLSSTFEYTLDFMGSPEGERVESFLFENRRGHCELFASSMVLMLRSQGIPARLATGFLGGDYNPIEGYFIVRQSNAHAWVEAYTESGGWQVFDPTPPAGRPIASEESVGQLAAQLYDYLVFRWDRYILTYGLSDQVGVLSTLRDVWQTISGWFGADEADPAGQAPVAAPQIVESPDAPEAVEPGPAAWWPLALALLLACGGFVGFRWRGFSAAQAYLRLRERLRDEYGEGLESVPPLEVAARLADRYPAGAGDTTELVGLYLEESFSGRPLTADDLTRARVLLRRTLRRKAA